MTIPSLSDNNELIQPYFSSGKILRGLLTQIKKDFLSAGITLKISVAGKYSYSELVKILSDILESTVLQKIFNLLYRIDISESQLKKEMPTPGIDFRLFSELIIKRELQKVILRQLYSSNSQNPI